MGRRIVHIVHLQKTIRLAPSLSTGRDPSSQELGKELGRRSGSSNN
jgi:hypothetical protein